MTPKEKAEYLISKYQVWKEIEFETFGYDIETAKKHALFHVDEILEENHKLDDYGVLSTQLLTARYCFWEDVRKEIKLL